MGSMRRREKGGREGTYEGADVNNSVVDWVGTINDELGGAGLDWLKYICENGSVDVGIVVT